MASKEELLASLIEQQKVLTEQSEAITVIENEECKLDARGDGGQEYVYWARRGELETAGEVEVCSSTGSENHEGGDVLIVDESVQGHTEVSTSQPEDEAINGVASSSVHHQNSIAIEECFPKVDLEHERRMEEKRETARLQEQIMNEEYQKAIGYLLCSSKSKSGKQKKKQTMTAYLFFCRRYRSKIVARNPKLSFAQISKLLSHMWRNASEQEKNTYRVKLEQHRTKVNAIVEKNMIEKMKMVKQQKLMDDMRRRNEEEIQAQLHDIAQDDEENEQDNDLNDSENEQGPSQGVNTDDKQNLTRQLYASKT